MILVPYEKTEIAEATRRSELDEQMAKILKRNDLDDRDKFRLYQSLLQTYLRHSQNKLDVKTNENREAQTASPQTTDYSTQTKPQKTNYSTQTIPQKANFATQTAAETSVQTSPLKSNVDVQASFSEYDKTNLGNTVIDNDYQYDTYNPGFYNNFSFDKYGFPDNSNRSIFDIRRSNLNDITLGVEKQVDNSFINPSKVKKKLDLDYNEPTPQRPSVLHNSILDTSLNNLNETIKQPITKLDKTNSKIFETPDATRNEISTYSPLERTLEVATPDINSVNITQRHKPSGWTQSRKSKKKKKKKSN